MDPAGNEGPSSPAPGFSGCCGTAEHAVSTANLSVWVLDPSCLLQHESRLPPAGINSSLFWSFTTFCQIWRPLVYSSPKVIGVVVEAAILMDVHLKY